VSTVKTITTIKEANAVVGGLSTPTKMPSYCYNIPAKYCRTGSRLREIKGSVCSKCYARKFHYTTNTVKTALQRRWDSLKDPQWVDAMVFLINIRKEKHKIFRWHDSGDLQSLQHFERIVEVVRRTPEVTHWLPTKEVDILREYMEKHFFTSPLGVLKLPENLCIRVSMYMIGQKPITNFLGLPTSTVNSGVGVICPVTNGVQGCDDFKCRACWDNEVKNVDYHLH